MKERRKDKDKNNLIKDGSNLIALRKITENSNSDSENDISDSEDDILHSDIINSMDNEYTYSEINDLPIN